MKNEERLAELWNDYLEGELDEREVAELRGLLEADECRLHAAAEGFRTHRLLGLLASSEAAAREEFVRDTMARLPVDDEAFVGGVMDRIPSRPSLSRRGPAWRWAVALGAAAILLAALVNFWPRAESGIVRIVELGGALQWTGDGGQVVQGLEVAGTLGGGTLETLSPDAWVVLEFGDGSTVTASGPSLLTISEREQKVLHLRHGCLSASVAPQEEGRPMLVHTPTAELEVLGTQFNLEAEPLFTSLTVNEGRVRLTRLTDGRVTEVLADHLAVATEAAGDELANLVRGQATPTWSGNLRCAVTHGKWISGLELLALELKLAVKMGELTSAEATAAYKDAAELENGPGCLFASPLVLAFKKTLLAEKKARGQQDWAKEKAAFFERPTMYLASLSVAREPDRPVVALVEGSRLLVEGRLRHPAEVVFGLTTQDHRGGVSGKFEALERIAVEESPNSSFRVELPIDRFLPAEHVSAGSPVGRELADWWCYTVEDAGLAILRVELLPLDSAEDR